MATATSRHHSSYRPAKTLPIAPPSKALPTYSHPVSRVALPPPEINDAVSSRYSGSSRGSGGTFSSNSSYAESHYSSDRHGGSIDIMDELSDRMNSVFDPMKMDRPMVKQAKMSGGLKADTRELEEMQALAQRRLRRTRVNFEEALEAGKEAREDAKYVSAKMAQMKAKAARDHPEAYEEARRARRHRS